MRSVHVARSIVTAAAVVAAATVIAITVARLRRGRAPRAGAPDEVAPEAAPEWMRRFVTQRFNPFVERLGLVGGRRSPWAYLEHVGRRTGIVYQTPVLPRLFGDFAYVPLPYGVDVNWARNVRVAGHCRLLVRGTTYDLDEPTVITPRDHPGVPDGLRDTLERRGRRYLRLHVLSAVPGGATPPAWSTAMPGLGGEPGGEPPAGPGAEPAPEQAPATSA